MSIATIQSRYGKENLVMCDHCHKLLHPEWSEFKFVVSGRDAKWQDVDFCDYWCAQEAGYAQCNFCGLWFPKDSLNEDHECQLCVKAKRKKRYIATASFYVQADTMEEAKRKAVEQMQTVSNDCFFNIKEKE